MHPEDEWRSAASPGLTPLIDAVFLLLVFFLLTSHFIRNERMPVHLPEAASGETMRDRAGIEIALAEDGRILLNGRPASEVDLERRLADLMRGERRKDVRIHGDRRASLEHLVRVMDAARRAGATAIDLVTVRR